jgi:glycerophosphoryl diester phosphodiesterase
MPDSPLLLGHRGARACASVPENTLASFDLALDHGCDGFEFDVRLTGCGRALVCHDPKVEGITVARATCEQLLNLPRLEDVLQGYCRRAFLDIEIKVPGLESKALLALHECAPENGYVVSSFLPEVLLDLRTRSAIVPLGLICDRQDQLARWRELPVEYVIPHHTLISKELVDEVHKADKKLFAWTVNDKASMLRLAEWGADAIVSDETELLVRTLRN